MQRLQIFEQCRSLFRFRQRRDQLARQERQFVRKGMPQQRELLRSVQVFRRLLACLPYDDIDGRLRLYELSWDGRTMKPALSKEG